MMPYPEEFKMYILSFSGVKNRRRGLFGFEGVEGGEEEVGFAGVDGGDEVRAGEVYVAVAGVVGGADFDVLGEGFGRCGGL